MPPWSNWVSSQWIYSHFEQYFMPGRIWNSTGQEILLKMGVNSLGLHLYACLYIVWLSGQFGSLNLHGFTPNSTGRIGSKSIEIMTTKAFNRQCNLNGFTPKSTSIYLNGFTPNLTGRIWLGINYWSNWVEIHWDYIVCLPGWIWWS